jgi:hypothetical protein
MIQPHPFQRKYIEKSKGEKQLRSRLSTLVKDLRKEQEKKKIGERQHSRS